MFNHLRDGPPWTDIDRQLADTMSSYWVNFARTGDPNGPGLPTWPAYSDGFGPAMILGDRVEVETSPTPSASNLEFFDSAYARALAGGAQ
jgi:para-nitrobenzyl esterase